MVFNTGLKKLGRFVVSAVVLSFPVTLYAQNLNTIISRIGWKGPGLPVIIFIVALFVAAIGFLTFHYLKNVQHLKRRRIENAVNSFRESVDSMGLNSAEIDKARELAEEVNLSYPHRVFESFSLFENGVHSNVENLLSKDISGSLLKEENAIISGVRRKAGFSVLPQEQPLVTTRNIEVGQKGAVFGRDNREPLIESVKVADKNEFFFSLKYEPEDEESHVFSEGDLLRFVFSRTNDGFYSVPFTIQRNNGEGLLTARHTKELKRTQLRAFVRMEMSKDMKIRLIRTSDPEKSEVKIGDSRSVRMLDISGGGLSFIDTLSLKAGDVVSLSFGFEDSTFSGIKGRIVRVSLRQGRREDYFRHHVKFDELETTTRDKIIRMIFKKQRRVAQTK